MDFDFARYVAGRKGQVQQRARDGATYAYLGERKVRRALVSARPVTLALEATQRLWKSKSKDELFEDAVLATDQNHPKLFAASKEAARILGIEAPPIYVSAAAASVGARALGTDDDPAVFVAPHLPDALSDSELLAMVGHQLGHIQNNHILYTTALYYLSHSAFFFVRWIVQPAIITLKAWSRRADVTCDRAALICTRDFDITASALVKMALRPEAQDRADEILAAVAEDSKKSGPAAWLSGYGDLLRSHPSIGKRLDAVRAFSQSQFYLKFTGQEEVKGAPSAEDTDELVARILAGGSPEPQNGDQEEDEA